MDYMNRMQSLHERLYIIQKKQNELGIKLMPKVVEKRRNLIPCSPIKNTKVNQVTQSNSQQHIPISHESISRRSVNNHIRNIKVLKKNAAQLPTLMEIQNINAKGRVSLTDTLKIEAAETSRLTLRSGREAILSFLNYTHPTFNPALSYHRSIGINNNSNIERYYTSLINGTEAISTNRPATSGASKRLLNSIQSFLPNDDENETDECSICLESMSNLNNLLLCKLPCKHFFHSKCIKTWLVRSSTCPLCKFVLKEGKTDFETCNSVQT